MKLIIFAVKLNNKSNFDSKIILMFRIRVFIFVGYPGLKTVNIARDVGFCIGCNLIFQTTVISRFTASTYMFWKNLIFKFNLNLVLFENIEGQSLLNT